MSDKLDALLAAARTHATDVITPNVYAWNAAKSWPRDTSDKALKRALRSSAWL